MKFTFLKRIAALLLVLACSHAWAESTHDSAITLNQAIQQTLTNNPALHAFDFRQQAIEGESTSAQLSPGYNLEAEVENVLGTGDRSGTQQAEFSLALSSVIELGNKVQARRHYTDAKQQRLEVEQQLRSLNVLAELTRRYISVLAQQEKLSVLQDAERLAQTTLEAVTKRVNAGASPLFEQKRAQAALAEARLQLSTAKQQWRSQKMSLAIMWGEEHPSFDQAKGRLLSLQPSPDFQPLVQRLKQSPNMQLFAEQARLQAAQLSVVQADSRANIRWRAGVSHFNDSNDTALVAGVSLPLLSQSRNRGAYQSQRAQTEQARQETQAQLRRLYHQLNQTLDARNRALLAVERLRKDILPPLEEALALVEKAYQDGRFSYLEWVSTRQELVDARFALIEAAKQAHQRGADLEALTGISLNTASQAGANTNNQAPNVSEAP